MLTLATIAILLLSTSQIRSEDVNKILPLHCHYVNDDVTYMKCTDIEIEVYEIMNQIRNIPLDERARVRHFDMYDIDMPAIRARSFDMFPNLTKLSLYHLRTYACDAKALQGLPNLEELFFAPGIGEMFHLKGLFANLNLKWLRFGIDFYGVESMKPIFNDIKKYELEYFKMQRCRISWANLTKCFQGEYLKTLILDSVNYLYDNYPHPIDKKSYFQTFTNLETLVLSKNRITEITDGAFGSQTKLKTLDLKWNWLRKVTPGMLQGLDQLTKLDLSWNLITIIAVEDFGNAWYTEPVLKVNLMSNPFECGCTMIENAKEFNNTGYQLIMQNFRCAGPRPLRYKSITDPATLESNLTTECAKPVMTNCCPNKNTIKASWDDENEVEIKCTATGIPAPKILCEPISGNPMPHDNGLYWEVQAKDSFTSRVFHAMKKESGKVRCTAVNPYGSVTKECAIVVENDWNAGQAITACVASLVVTLSIALLLNNAP